MYRIAADYWEFIKNIILCNSSLNHRDIEFLAFKNLIKIYKQIERELFSKELKRIESKIDAFALKGINLLEPEKAGTTLYKNIYSVLDEYKNPVKNIKRPKRIKRKKFLFEK